MHVGADARLAQRSRRYETIRPIGPLVPAATVQASVNSGMTMLSVDHDPSQISAEAAAALLSSSSVAYGVIIS